MHKSSSHRLCYRRSAGITPGYSLLILSPSNHCHHPALHENTNTLCELWESSSSVHSYIWCQCGIARKLPRTPLAGRSRCKLSELGEYGVWHVVHSWGNVHSRWHSRWSRFSAKQIKKWSRGQGKCYWRENLGFIISHIFNNSE